DLSLDILPVLHWILTDFRSALGDVLANQIEMCISRILSHAYKMHAQRPLAKAKEFRFKSYFEPQHVSSWIPTTAEEWADALITYQMAGSKQDSLLENALQNWNAKLCLYIGPQTHDRAEPKVTLFDLFMGHYFGAYSQRALQNRRVHLQASLI